MIRVLLPPGMIETARDLPLFVAHGWVLPFFWALFRCAPTEEQGDVIKDYARCAYKSKPESKANSHRITRPLTETFTHQKIRIPCRRLLCGPAIASLQCHRERVTNAILHPERLFTEAASGYLCGPTDNFTYECEANRIIKTSGANPFGSTGCGHCEWKQDCQ